MVEVDVSKEWNEVEGLILISSTILTFQFEFFGLRDREIELLEYTIDTSHMWNLIFGRK